MSISYPKPDQLSALRSYFNSGVTKPYDFRKEQLLKLKKTILLYEQELYTALYTDLRKSPEESWVTELGLVISSISHTIRHLRQWMEPERVGTNLVNLPSGSRVMREPLGVVLVIGPWNYPLQLLLKPMLSAMAAGNCVVIKPSEFAPATAAVIKKMITELYPPDYILYVEGEGGEVVPAMMNHFTFDHVFYTGSTAVGRLVYKMAADRLVPVTLELGGKSPCIVAEDAQINVAARRIAVAKYSNAGQMCVTPDYILVHSSKKEELLIQLKKAIIQFFTDNPQESYNYCKIINEKQFDRITRYFSEGTLFHGGRMDKSQLYIEPSILTAVAPDSIIMKEEIFGPVLPVLTFNTNEEAKKIIEQNPNPLAFYLFTSSSRMEKYWLNEVQFGGGCVNNASWHLTNENLPFGGRGASGIGRYHGRYGFDTFTHQKAVMKTPTWFDPDLKYPPFKGRLRLFKWMIK